MSSSDRKRQGQTAELAQSLLASGWQLRLRVFGSSMKPLLRAGSVVRIGPCIDAPSVGEIVLYRAVSGRLIAHRVVGCESQKYRTKGDSSGEADGLIERCQIMGRILGFESLFFVPLGGPLAQRLGLLLNRHYPKLVRCKRAILQRLVGSSPGLAEGS